MSFRPPTLMPPPLPDDGLQAGILIAEQVIDDGLCRRLCEYMDREYRKNPGVSNEQRTAFIAPIDRVMRSTLVEVMCRISTDYIVPHFEADIEWWELPQLLRYEKGGRYDAHSDAENISKDPNKPGWVKVHDRDISILAYLNEDFTGGLLSFPDHQRKIAPRTGLLVAFPSHHGYRHAAEPTMSGVRYVMVSWAAVRGSPRVRAKAPQGHIFMDSPR